MFLVDSHCHLNKLNYKNVHKNVSDVLDKAHKKGVKLVLSVSTDLSDYDDMIRIVGNRNDVLFSCGIHPINLSSISYLNQNKLYDLASDKKVIAIGETGLDYHRCIDKKEIQKKSFRKHISIAKDLKKPLIVHSRKAIQDTIILLIEENAEKCGGILHCFSENIDIARALLDINFYISFSGMITFNNSEIFKKVIQYIPLDYILLETDSPYLAPIPYRGHENQPAYIYEIASYVAQIKNMTIEYVARVTTDNFYRLFHIS